LTSGQPCQSRRTAPSAHPAMTKPRKRVLTPKGVSKESVKAAAARAVARSAGEEIEHKPAPITPPIVPAAELRGDKKKAVEKRRKKRVHYSPAVGKAVCKMIVKGVPVIKIGQRPLMPSESSIYAWAKTPGHPFGESFARAREVAVRRMADEMLVIADNSAGDAGYKEARDGSPLLVVNREVIERSRLRIETRKWLLSKLLPAEFSEKVAIDHSGRVEQINTEAPQPTGADHLEEITKRFRAKAPAATVPPPGPAKANGKGSGLH